MYPAKKMFTKNSSSRKELSLLRKKLFKYTKQTAEYSVKNWLGNKMIWLVIWFYS